jgi:hypothetical protein
MKTRPGSEQFFATCFLICEALSDFNDHADMLICESGPDPAEAGTGE